MIFMYKIVIPTFKRYDTLQNKTLHMLAKNNIDPKLIDIFVADEQEYYKYKKTLNSHYFNKIIIGKHTLHKQRNFIQQYYKENQKLLWIDDDIEEIQQLHKGKLIPIRNLDNLIRLGFKICLKNNTRLLGIYPVNNAFFMKNTIHSGLYYIIGCFYWTINTHNKELSVQLEDKEDFERSIKYYKKYGKVLRFDNITVKTNYYNEKGGMQETRTNKRITQSAYYLIKKYPTYCEINSQRKKHTEIKFKKQKNNHKIKLKVK